MHAAPIRDRLPDHAAHADARGIALDRVGIRGLGWPITVWDRARKLQATVARIDASVSLPASVKGTHMSRFVEVLNGVRGELSLNNLPELLATIQRRLGADRAQLDVRFPYFMTRTAPVSGAESLMEYTCGFHAKREGGQFDFVLAVDVPVTTLCPCSKAVSRRGAHNQRSVVSVRVRSKEFLWIEDVVEAVEPQASSPLYALLKREDEKFVTERAYDHPVFVEDLIREVVVSLRSRSTWLHVAVENIESIHNHSAFAEVTWEGAPPTSTPTEPRRRTRRAPPFGTWLKAQRASRGWSQDVLAARLGISPSLLSRVEGGARSLSEATLPGLAEALGHEVDAIRLRAGVVPKRLLDRVREDPEGFLRWAEN